MGVYVGERASPSPTPLSYLALGRSNRGFLAICNLLGPLPLRFWLDRLGYPGLLTFTLSFQRLLFFLFAYAGWFLRKGGEGRRLRVVVFGWMDDG